MQNQNSFFAFFLTGLIILLPTLISSQKGVANFDDEFTWSKKSTTETIYIDVKKGADALALVFEGSITEGDLDLIAYDPDGNKVAGFSLETAGSNGVQVFVETGQSDNELSITTHGENGASTISYGSNIDIKTDSDGESKSYTIRTGPKDKKKKKNKNKNKNKNKDKTSKSYTVTSTSEGSQNAKGVMTKVITDPMPGQWKIVMDINNVTGELSAKIDQD